MTPLYPFVSSDLFSMSTDLCLDTHSPKVGQGMNMSMQDSERFWLLIATV